MMEDETKVPTFTTAKALVEYVRETADHSYRALQLLGIPANAGIMNRWEMLKECSVREVLDGDLDEMSRVLEDIEGLFEGAVTAVADLKYEVERANSSMDDLTKVQTLIERIRK